VKSEKHNGQLYETETEQPQYKVGDWVEFNPGSNPQQVCITMVDGEKLHYICKNGYQSHIHARAIMCKLQPSEVVLDFGAFRGTIVAGINDSTIMVIPVDYDGMMDVCIVAVHMLTPELRSQVEELLKAQENNK